ncbi:MAG: hypothetical protein V6Z78_05115 [Holosporaceae bacterium]
MTQSTRTAETELQKLFGTLDVLLNDAQLVPSKVTLQETLEAIKALLEPALCAHARLCADLEDDGFWMECWMARFDLLAPFKGVLRKAYHQSPQNPSLLFYQTQHIYWNFYAMVQQRANLTPLETLSKTLFLTGAYVQALPCWLADDTADLSHTTPLLTRRIQDPSLVAFVSDLV